MKAQLTLIPKITIHPDRINLYNEIHWDPVRPKREKLFLPENYIINKCDRIIDSKRTASGLVSNNASRKIKRALDYFLLMAAPTKAVIPKTGKSFTFRLVFVTFDLPSKQIHDDNTIKEQILNQMIIELVRYHGVKNYIWRAEKQKNGNIHFHLIIDKFIMYNILRKRWNRICNKLGYVDRYRDNQEEYHKNGFRVRKELLTKWTEEQQRKAWIEGKKTNWSSPNSTDIHSVKHIYKLKDYITKYITKNPDKSQLKPDNNNQDILVKGRIWACSQNLSNIKGFDTEIDNEITEELKKIEKLEKIYQYSDTYFSIKYIDIQMLQKHSPNVLFIYFARYMAERFDYNMQLATG
jgi:hypothetical protein